MSILRFAEPADYHERPSGRDVRPGTLYFSRMFDTIQIRALSALSPANRRNLGCDASVEDADSKAGPAQNFL